MVSSDEKAVVAYSAGADEVLRSDGAWKDDLSARVPSGVDLVIDTVGDQTLDSLRALRPGGRLVIVGFASGEIPEIKVNRLLLRNLEVIGARYGAYAAVTPGLSTRIATDVDQMIREGHIAPIVGARFPLERASAALGLLESRQALGKVVLEIGSPSTPEQRISGHMRAEFFMPEEHNDPAGDVSNVAEGERRASPERNSDGLRVE